MDKQRDFEKGWEEYKAKKKQEIEELEKDISKDLQGVLKTEIKSLARGLNKLGYRKIPENAVVLTREEHEKLQEKIRVLEVQLDLERTRTLEEWLVIKEKETAEKFAERLKEAVSDISFKASTVGFDGYQSCSAVNPNSIIERIDEICKEITEG